MSFAKITKMYKCYLCNATLVTNIYYVIDIQQLITPLRNIFQQYLVVVSAIYLRLSARNIIQNRLDLTFCTVQCQGTQCTVIAYEFSSLFQVP